MGFFDSPKRPIKIKLLNVENQSSVAMLTYTATYSDQTSKNIRTNVKYLNSSFVYSNEPHIIQAECLGKVYIGLLKDDTRLFFLVKLSDHTMDIIQEKEGTTRCNDLLAKSMGEDHTKEKHHKTESISSKNVEDIDIPIEILPNLYSLSISNVAIKHHQSYKDGKKEFDYVTLKCRVNYRLNGRKEGKRHIIFTSYDEKDRVVEIRGEYDKYHFTEAGYEFVETCFNDFGNNPISKIGISIKEIHHYRD